MTTNLFQASQDGNVELVSSLLEEPSLDIDARDETGLTALHHAVRANHTDVVTQLLAKGANAVEVAQDSALKSNPELASIINNALQHTQSAAFRAAPVVDSHGGKQLPDGTVSYVQPPAYQGQSVDSPMQQPLAFNQHHMSQPAYAFQPQPNFFDPSHNPEHRSHAPKDSSSGSLPPPEVARMIPCRFFPNCRYGEKCIFAHPVAMPTTPNSAGPVSPGQAPMFYQSAPYGYPAYGPPQHFYSMASPMPIQYTHAEVPMPVHMPPAPHMGPASHNVEQGDAYGSQFAAQPRQHFASSTDPEGEAEAVNSGASQQADAEATGAKAELASSKPAKSSASASNATTTSFSAFMAHHAAPFQPGPGVSVGADGSIVNGAQSFPRGAKGARRGGAQMGGSFGSRSEFSKRSSERPACHFFARSACKNAEDCRFPHILPDGTDARGHNAGRSSHSIEASRAINRALAAKSARANGSAANSNNAAQPAPSADAEEESAVPTNVTASTSLASAQTTITSSQKAEGSKASTERNASKEVAEKSSAASSSSAPAAGAPAVKKEQTGAAKSSAANGSASASASKAVNANIATSGKADAKADNVANGKRSVGKAEDAKPASTLPSGTNGDRIPASIPSRPVVNGNGSGSQGQNKQNGAKAQHQPNGVQHAKGQSNQHGARARNNQGTSGRSNSQAGQNGTAAKKPAPQRLPNADDFPALSNGPATTSSAAPVTSNGAAKPNFSAILSAPAPVKKQPEPVEKTEAAPSDDKTASAAPADAGAQENSASTNESEAKPSAAKQTSGNGNAAPMLDFAAVVQSNPVAV